MRRTWRKRKRRIPKRLIKCEKASSTPKCTHYLIVSRSRLTMVKRSDSSSCAIRGAIASGTVTGAIPRIYGLTNLENSYMSQRRKTVSSLWASMIICRGLSPQTSAWICLTQSYLTNHTRLKGSQLRSLNSKSTKISTLARNSLAGQSTRWVTSSASIAKIKIPSSHASLKSRLSTKRLVRNKTSRLILIWRGSCTLSCRGTPYFKQANTWFVCSCFGTKWLSSMMDALIPTCVSFATMNSTWRGSMKMQVRSCGREHPSPTNKNTPSPLQKKKSKLNGMNSVQTTVWTSKSSFHS